MNCSMSNAPIGLTYCLGLYVRKFVCINIQSDYKFQGSRKHGKLKYVAKDVACTPCENTKQTLCKSYVVDSACNAIFPISVNIYAC